ncbi:MAG: DUF3450 domain-containing protein [Alphaproteobacteria bacterium]
MQSWRISAILSVIAAVACLSGPAAAQIDAATNEVEQTTDQGAASQRRIDSISDDTDEVVRNYRSVLRQVDDLKAYNRQREELVAAQEAEKESIREQIERVKTIERDIVPLTERMIATIAEFVELDVPFNEEERSERIERLQNLMARPDVNIAEKFRVVLEAYQIENDYGRSIEAYQGILRVDGKPDREVDFLTIGRVGFYYQTLDRAETGIWNQEERRWDVLDASAAGPVRLAMDMAREYIPPELLILPMFGPQAQTAN